MNLQQLEHAEVLTRSQLKKVLGGTFGSTTAKHVTLNCKGTCQLWVSNPVNGGSWEYGNCVVTDPGLGLPDCCGCSLGAGTGCAC